MNLDKYLNNSKIIAAVKDNEALDTALLSDCKVIFLLSSDISSVQEIVSKCHKYNKIIFLHFDMINGFGKDEAAVKYIKETFKPDGIISIKSNVIRWAYKYDLQAIFRIFLVDSQSVDSAINNITHNKIENIEIMPGIMPSVIKKLVNDCPANYIAGGLISEKAQVEAILKSGAIACSTSKQDLWKVKLS